MKRRLSEMWLLVTADRKRAAILGTLLLVLTGVGAKMFLFDGPRRARASNADATSEKSGADRKASGKSSSSGQQGSRTNAAEYGAPERRTVIPAANVVRDLFALNDERFKPLQTEPSDKGAGLAGKSQTGSVEKETSAPVSEAEVIRQRVLEEASHLRLRSILLGSRPAAVIESSGGKKGSSMVVAVGQTIDGFSLVSIGSEGVVVEKDGVQVQLHRELPEH